MKDERFARSRLLFGDAGMDRLRQARVLVAGLGAVGSYAVEGLARSGVGHLCLVDFDEVRPSNINRQLYALESTLGRRKTDVARSRVLDINPTCAVETRDVFIDGKVARDLLATMPDVVIDAIDSVSPKVELLAAAVGCRVPVIISSMGAATRTDPSSVRVADIGDTRECPLAKFVRKKLKKRGIESGIRCVFSLEPPGNMDASITDESGGESLGYVRGRARKPLASFSCMTGLFGLIAAREAIMAITGGTVNQNSVRGPVAHQ